VSEPGLSTAEKVSDGAAGRVARMFVDSKLTPLLVVASILLGLASVFLLPREEEPQIKVPMIDVMVSMPGASAREVAERVTRPMEQLLWEIPGVEYVYSTSRPAESLVIVRFKVGSDLEQSLVKLNQKLQTNFDRIPHGVTAPLIKPRTIDDVPILALTLHSAVQGPMELRRLAAELQDTLKQIPQVAETSIIGGLRRKIRVQLDPVRMASRGVTAAGIIPMIQQSNRQTLAGGLTAENRTILIESGGFITDAAEAGQVVVGVYEGRPVYLRDVAEIIDGPEEPASYVYQVSRGTGIEPAVTISIAKQPGTNAVDISHAVMRKVAEVRGRLLPADVEVTVTRDYGETATEKSNELLFHMAIAVVSVSLLVMFVLGWRESIVVAIAIPTTLALTLLVFYLYGYTLNRITLFALIFSIGILVDDAIVVVENVVRHYRMPHNRRRNLSEVAIEAVAEVGNPTILATLAVIAAILPMAFVSGLMGPYMRPIPIGASAAMFWSLLIAFIVTPWAARRMLAGEVTGKNAHAEGEKESKFTLLYRQWMGHLIHDVKWRWAFLGGIVLLLLGSFILVPLGFVKVKMLPFDNKSEFQVILNMPEDSSLEQTAAVAREMADALLPEPEVRDVQIYTGTASPFNFNGLVRHYFMRSGPAVADLQVNLLSRHDRMEQSHDIAKRVRPRLAAIAKRHNARLAVAEVPPGPPVLQTIVAEIYGPDEASRLKLAGEVKKIFEETTGVVDVDWYVESDQPKARFVVDKEKAALNGISADTIARTLAIATTGQSVDLIHQPREKEDVNLVLELARRDKSSPEQLLALRVRSGDANALPEPGTTGGAPLVPLRELVRVDRVLEDKSIYHKNLMPVVYVMADVAGEVESPVYAILEMNRRIAELDAADFGGVAGAVEIYNANLPFTDFQPSIKWDGEWHITIEVFRDLGLAFIAVLILIYLLMVGWFGSFITPLVVMAAIPFSLVGILPAHGFMDAFFSAPSMIGFMAGAGIVVRNSIILVDFIQLRRAQGMPLDEAVIDAGAVRFRPMMLTAMAVVVGAGVILFDPIFQGLAISLMAGEIASLFLSRMAVPVLYFLTHRNEENATPSSAPAPTPAGEGI
jgi:multidrug efflux pump subunit AcrB